MKPLLGILVALVLMGAALTQMTACYPTPVCTPPDRSCLPCNDPRNTNPACPPFPQDAKHPDGGSK